MKIIADLHIHSKYSRATSKDMDLTHIKSVAQIKGITVVGTGDFTHPEWFKQLQEQLEPAEEGLYKMKEDKEGKVRFVVTGEISNIYSRGGKTRRIHNLVVLPSLESAAKINSALSWQGNLKADGRPILGMDSEELLKIVFQIEPQALFIPAHIWTPWFGLFGSMSGFDSLQEAFGENVRYISALETGLSSDPPMNWRLSQLDQFCLVSNSDAHSPDHLAREANVFDTELNYFALRDAILKKDKSKFLYTIEFYPEEGKYHYDGHRNCGVRMSPQERKEVNGICPVCHRPLTVGVLSRVDALADREEGFIPSSAIPYRRLIPLKEIIGEVLQVGVKTKKVEQEYNKLIYNFSTELAVLLEVPYSDLAQVVSENIARAIEKAREGEVVVEPGYDGEYGKIRITSEKKENPSQAALFS